MSGEPRSACCWHCHACACVDCCCSWLVSCSQVHDHMHDLLRWQSDTCTAQSASTPAASTGWQQAVQVARGSVLCHMAPC